MHKASPEEQKRNAKRELIYALIAAGIGLLLLVAAGVIRSVTKAVFKENILLFLLLWFLVSAVLYLGLNAAQLFHDLNLPKLLAYPLGFLLGIGSGLIPASIIKDGAAWIRDAAGFGLMLLILDCWSLWYILFQHDR